MAESNSDNYQPFSDYFPNENGQQQRRQQEKIDLSQLNPMHAYYPSANGAEYLFAEDYDPFRRRSWSDRVSIGSGMTYLFGLASGGAFGLYEGVRQSAGEALKLRQNVILNRITSRGPRVGNSLGCIALMYNLIDGGIYQFRGKNDALNNCTAAGLATAIFRSPAGPRAAAVAGLGGAAMMGAWSVAALIKDKIPTPAFLRK